VRNTFVNTKLYKPKTPRKHAGTSRRQEVYDFYRRYWNEHGFGPTYQECADELGVSGGAVYQHVNALADDGELEFDRKQTWRGVRVVAYDQQHEQSQEPISA
jgi:SOS-response transcriptional repressor LexA